MKDAGVLVNRRALVCVTAVTATSLADKDSTETVSKRLTVCPSTAALATDTVGLESVLVE